MKITAIVPAYNEEKSIVECVASLVKQTRLPDEIVLVNDGSSDRTGLLASMLAHIVDRLVVVSLAENSGNKALALKAGSRYISGDIVVCLDADSELDSRYIELVERRMKDPSVGAVCGRVISKSFNIITMVRQLEYLLADLVFKPGQDVMGTIFVAPGVGGAFRAYLFKKELSADTVAEDMDLTLSVHEAGFKVVYEGKAIAYTQDPPNLRSYIRQLRRWHSGFFQCFRKHLRRVGIRLKMYFLGVVAEGVVWVLTTALALAGGMLAPLALWAAMEVALGLLLAWRGRGYGLKLYLAALVMPVFRVLSQVVWWQSLVSELLLKRKLTAWLRADRYA